MEEALSFYGIIFEKNTSGKFRWWISIRWNLLQYLAVNADYKNALRNDWNARSLSERRRKSEIRWYPSFKPKLLRWAMGDMSTLCKGIF